MPQEAGMHMHHMHMHPEQLQLAAAHLPAEDEAAVERSGCPGSNADRSPSPSPSPNPSPNPNPAPGPDPSRSPNFNSKSSPAAGSPRWALRGTRRLRHTLHAAVMRCSPQTIS